jgi:hypothetical protein
MDKVLPDIKGNARRQRKVFSDDGKKRISIVMSLDFTQDVSRIIKHRKPAIIFDDRMDGRTITAFRLQGRTPLIKTLYHG